jgi:hypothetical protein
VVEGLWDRLYRRPKGIHCRWRPLDWFLSLLDQDYVVVVLRKRSCRTQLEFRSR